MGEGPSRLRTGLQTFKGNWVGGREPGRGWGGTAEAGEEKMALEATNPKGHGPGSARRQNQAGEAFHRQGRNGAQNFGALRAMGSPRLDGKVIIEKSSLFA